MAEGKKSFIEYLTYPDGDYIPLKNALRALLGESVWDAYQGAWFFSAAVLDGQTWSFDNGVWLALQNSSGVEPVEGSQWTLIFNGDAIPAGPQGPQGLPGPSVSAGIRRDVDVQSPDTVWVVPRLPVESAAWAIASLTPTAAPSFIRTAGYGGPGDRGAALYKKVDVEPTHPGKFAITLASGAVTAWYELSEAAPSIAMFGANSGALVGAETAAQRATTNSTAINAALAFCRAKVIRSLLVPEGVFTCNDDLNMAGVFMPGSGRVIVIGSGKPLSFGYLDAGRDIVGAHNLVSFYSTMISQNGVANIALEGDSNMESSPVWIGNTKAYPHNALRDFGRILGFAPQVYNFGVSGSGAAAFTPDVATRSNMWFSPIPAWLADTNYMLLIWSPGTNDASGGEAAYRANLRAGLTKVRAARGFNLGVLLLSPPTGTDSYGPAPTSAVHGRDESWALTCRNVMLEMVDEFNVAVVDRVTAYRHMRGGYGGVHMDELNAYDSVLYQLGTHIHARDLLNAHYWGNIVASAVFPPSLALFYKANKSVVRLTSDTDFVPLQATTPTTYEPGRNFGPVLAANGFPFDATLLNDRHPTHASYQHLLAQGYGAMRHGVATYVDDWHIIGKQLLDPVLGTNVTVAGVSTKSVKTGSHGDIQSYFNITGNIAVDQLLVTLPVGHRPPYATVKPMATGAGAGSVLIQPNGQVTAKSTHTAPLYFGFGPWVI